MNNTSSPISDTVFLSKEDWSEAFTALCDVSMTADWACLQHLQQSVEGPQPAKPHS